MKLRAQIVVDVDESEVNKLNSKRKRLGKQTRTAEEELVNNLSDALMHTFIFDPIEVKVQPCVTCGGKGTINTGGAWKPCPECA